MAIRWETELRSPLWLGERGCVLPLRLGRPPSRLQRDEVIRIRSYLRAVIVPVQPVPGDAERLRVQLAYEYMNVYE
eukprot:scaffold617500_cov18-Prasinocladus_malaysianus.AAC.1